MKKEAVNPASVWSNASGFSQAVSVSGDTTLYVSGQVAWDVQRRLIGANDLGVQAKQAFENLKSVVEAAGATMSDVVSVRISIVGYRPEMAPIVGLAFGDAFSGEVKPACTWIGVAALADPGFLIEVEATAVFERSAEP